MKQDPISPELAYFDCEESFSEDQNPDEFRIEISSIEVREPQSVLEATAGEKECPTGSKEVSENDIIIDTKGIGGEAVLMRTTGHGLNYVGEEEKDRQPHKERSRSREAPQIRGADKRALNHVINSSGSLNRHVCKGPKSDEFVINIRPTNGKPRPEAEVEEVGGGAEKEERQSEVLPEELENEGVQSDEEAEQTAEGEENGQSEAEAEAADTGETEPNMYTEAKEEEKEVGAENGETVLKVDAEDKEGEGEIEEEEQEEEEEAENGEIVIEVEAEDGGDGEIEEEEEMEGGGGKIEEEEEEEEEGEIEEVEAEDGGDAEIEEEEEMEGGGGEIEEEEEEEGEIEEEEEEEEEEEGEIEEEEEEEEEEEGEIEEEEEEGEGEGGAENGMEDEQGSLAGLNEQSQNVPRINPNASQPIHRRICNRNRRNRENTWSMSKIPARLNQGNESANKPNIVSIGPYHHQDSSLGAMEAEKHRLFERLLRRIRRHNITKESLESAMQKLVARTRQCYSEGLHHIDSKEFVQMMVLDGCFIIELLRMIEKNKQGRESKDPVFSSRWKLPVVRRDLLLFENQLPWFVLQKLFDLTTYCEHETPLVKLALDFFKPLKIGNQEISIDESKIPTRPRNMLELYHCSWIPENFRPRPSVQRKGRKTSKRNTIQTQGKTWIRNATSLKSSGVVIRNKPAGKLLDIEFRNGRLRVPTLVIDENTIFLLGNLLAYEQCNQNAKPYFTCVVAFFSSIAVVPDDIKLLREAGIIRHGPGADEMVVDIFKGLCKNLEYDMNDCYISKQVEDINRFCQSFSFKKWGLLMRRNPRLSGFLISIFTVLLSLLMAELFGIRVARL